MSSTNRILPYAFVLIQFICLGLIAITGPLIANSPVLLGAELLGIFLGLWAVLVMRIGNFNVTPTVMAGAKLVEGGPYRFIRHPMYAALLLVTLPLVLDSFSLLRLSIWLVLLVDLVLKLRHEEQLLASEVEGYPGYVSRTKKLLPLIF